jgi:DNA-binding Lrp family transcriptional regulator
MADKKYRAYILLRLSNVGKEWDVVERIKAIFEQGLVTYAVPVYGAWDIMVEVSYADLGKLDMIVTNIREDEVLGAAIEETTTMVGARATYPW